jgi:transcriptional regulator with GAF, ATPase, and Fis domain
MTADIFPHRAVSSAGVSGTDEPSTEIVGNSEAFLYMCMRLQQVAATSATVLLLGETGTGKGLAAREVHRLSTRRDARFVSVNCGSLPATLIESELFGRERGAFTDARSTQIGRFELADGGTIFLDEIGELPPETQVKLLRILQYGEFERLGSPRTLRVDVRVIAATNRNLIAEARAGRFRRDLYYRLNVFPIHMPSLRERQSDISILTDHLVRRLAQKHQRTVETIPRHVYDALLAYDWPGNIRELENVLERAIIAMSGSSLQLLEALTPEVNDGMVEPPSNLLIDVERAHILRMLHASAWRIEGPRGAARALGINPSTLRSRMRKLGVRRSQIKSRTALSWGVA